MSGFPGYRREDPNAPWYERDDTKIRDLDSDEETGVTALHGRETPDGWEYAIVRWRFGTCGAHPIFKNGVVTSDD